MEKRCPLTPQSLSKVMLTQGHLHSSPLHPILHLAVSFLLMKLEVFVWYLVCH